MTFESQVWLSIGVAVAAFVLLTAITLYRQRARRRRSIHWFAIFVLSSLIGAATGIGAHLAGTSPLESEEIAVEPL